MFLIRLLTLTAFLYFNNDSGYQNTSIFTYTSFDTQYTIVNECNNKHTFQSVVNNKKHTFTIRQNKHAISIYQLFHPIDKP